MKYIIFAILWIAMSCVTSQALELSKGEIFWLTQNIYWETRNQSDNGRITVAVVTINRMMSWQLSFSETGERWPRSIKGVVVQPKRFSWYWDGKSDVPFENEAEVWKDCKTIAITVSKLWDMLEPEYKKIFWYHRYDVNWKYKDHYQVWSQVDDHIFYIPKSS